MGTKKRGLMIGAGNWAADSWIRKFWTPFRDRMEIVALVDVNPEALDRNGKFLGLPVKSRFTSMAAAFDHVEADFCCVVVPPAFHLEAVERACARNMHILSEKPISGTWDACCAVYQAVAKAGVKMLVTQNRRYTPRFLTLRKAARTLGKVNYVMTRFAMDHRKHHSWGGYRGGKPHSLLVEGGVHHLDQIRALCDANCLSIGGYEWNPGLVREGYKTFSGSEFFEDDHICSLLNMRMTEGSFAHYEGNLAASGKTNNWGSEYYRVECEGGAAVLDRDDVVRIEERGQFRGAKSTLNVREVPLEALQWEGHYALSAQFLDWLEGGPMPPTALADNLQSNAMVFGAIEAARAGIVVDVRKMVHDATTRAEVL